MLARSNRSASTTRNQRTAARHLARALGHESPDALALVDLTSDNLVAAKRELIAGGMSFTNANQQRSRWLAIARAAKSAGLLAWMPRCPRTRVAQVEAVGPWPLSKVERIFASARAESGTVADLPADKWWVALLSVLIDTALPLADVLAVPKVDYDRRTGTLCSGLLSYQLHPRAVEALDAIRFHKQEKLIPWPYDPSRAPFPTLLARYRELLWRAGLPYGRRNLFQRLQLTARRRPTLLDDLRFDAVLASRAEQFPVSAQRQSLPPQQMKYLLKKGFSRARIAAVRQARETAPVVYRIAIHSPRTLLTFFNERYRPQRLSDAAERTVAQYRQAIDFLSWYLGCDATVDCLTDDLIEGFLAHRKQLGIANATLNRYRGYLLALWRHAWRKRLIAELPRDVFKYTVPKRLPEAWSTEEVARLLATAAETPGKVCGIPAGRFWAALLLTLYDTGLRIAALMSARCVWLSADGWLSIPADVQKQDADQAFRLHPDTLAAIQATEPTSRELLFPFPECVDPQYSLRYHYRKILKRAGLACGRRDMFHKLRRTSATAVCDAFDEVTASKHLGHSSLDVTRRYIDPRKLTRKQNAAEAITRPVLEAPTSRSHLEEQP